MEKKTLYTAIGRLGQRKGKGGPCPAIAIGKEEYLVDLQELMLWAGLSWRILRREEMETVYRETLSRNGNPPGRPFRECLDRLLLRGLIISGSGSTEYDALYDLVGSLHIIPAEDSFGAKMFSLFWRVFDKKMLLPPRGMAFRKDIRSDVEKQVMGLARQAELSTAEMVKCVEFGISRLHNEEGIMDSLYSDQETTSDNICHTARTSAACEPVTLAVANLYLRRQIVFGRV